MTAVRRPVVNLRWLRRIGPVRLATIAIVVASAVMLARFSWQVPVLIAAERGLYDIRTTLTAPKVDQDQRITMVVFTEQTLQRSQRRSPLDRRLLATAMRTLDGMGARSIGVDVLIDQPVAGEDDELIATLKAMKTPTYFAFAGNDDTSAFIMPWQEQHLRGFLAAVKPAVRPASIRLVAQGDGVVRRWPEESPYARPLSLLLTGSKARPMGSILYRQPKFLDRPVFNKLGVELFAIPGVGASLAPLVRGKVVFVGADLPTDDRLPTPDYILTGNSTPGTEIHAHMAAQALDGAWQTQMPAAGLWLCAIIAVIMGAVTSLEERHGWAWRIALAIQGLVLVGGPFWLAADQRFDSYGFPALGWLLGWLIAFIVVGAAARSVSADQRRFAQGALGQYLPKDVAQLILQEPERLALSGEDREIFALFTDLEGFTKLSHKLTPHQVGVFMNAYLDQLCDIVLKYGGTIDKFVGDAVVAFWGAPVSRPDDARNALAAAHEMAAPLNLKIDTGGTPIVGRTRVGLHHGGVVVGNFGGSGRMQYTALGDAMNTAARLEAANKAMKTRALVSREARDRMPPDGPGLRPMGRIVLRGRETPIEVYEPTEDKALADRLEALYRRFDIGDREALAELQAVVAERPDDIALDFFVFRLLQVGPGGSFTLE